MRKELALDNNQYNKVYKVYFKQAKEQAKRMEKMQKERKKFEMEMKVILNDVQYKRYLEMKRPARYNKRPAHKMGFNKPDGALKPAPHKEFKSRPMHGKPMQIQEEAYGDRRKNKNMYFEPKQDAKKSERK